MKRKRETGESEEMEAGKPENRENPERAETDRGGGYPYR